MKIRGERECKACGTRWSYYETGSVECPQCGSLRSVGRDDRSEHTANPTDFDLTPVRNAVDEVPHDELTDRAAARAREYSRQTGFIDAGTLQPLSDTFVAAHELIAVCNTLGHAMEITEDEEFYLLALLSGADKGERPDPAEIPESLRGAHGLAGASATERYHQELRTYLDNHPDELARQRLGSVRDHRKRIEALDGDVPVRTTESLIAATRAIGRAVIEDDDGALAEADQHLDSLEPGT